MGCFNITTLQNFDANRIFDLTHYRIWDLVLWWYDIDLIVFDFFLDFFNCISFLLIFINTFFYKIFFNFLNFTITINAQCYYHIIKQHYITFLFFYIFFFFNIVLNFLFFYFEIFFFFDLYFTMDTHIISVTYTYLNKSNGINNNTTCFFYFLFFLFILFFFYYIYLFAIKSIFSILCESNNTVLDIMYALTTIPINLVYYFNIFYIMKMNYIVLFHHKNTFFFLSIYNFFLLILFSLISVFFLLQNVTLKNNKIIYKNINIQITKQNKFFFRLENVILITVFKFIKNEIIKYIQINLINFLINFFSYIIKDITYLNSIIYYYFNELFFSINSINNVKPYKLIIKTQLIFLKQI